MFQTLEAENADSLWLKAAHWFTPDGIAAEQKSRAGVTSEVLRASLCIQDPRQRWITSRVPAMNPAFALAEVIWIMCGRNDAGLLNYFNPKLPRFAGSGSAYHGAYGFRLRRHFGLDQLERAYQILKADPESRQVVLQIWDSTVDLPNEDGTVQSPDIPCNVFSLLKIREGRLEWTQIMRSNDLVLGLPHNIVQFTSLQEVLAGWLGIPAGAYHHFADSLHLYERDAPVSHRITLRSLPFNADSIAFPRRLSEQSFSSLAALGDKLSCPLTTAEDSYSAFQEIVVEPAFRPWAAVLTADALRRQKEHRLMENVMAACQNACLATLFERWLSRHGETCRN